MQSVVTRTRFLALAKVRTLTPADHVRLALREQKRVRAAEQKGRKS